MSTLNLAASLFCREFINPTRIIDHIPSPSKVPLYPTPYTLHPTPYTLHPTPYTLHPTPYTLHPTLYTLELPASPHPSSCVEQCGKPHSPCAGSLPFTPNGCSKIGAVPDLASAAYRGTSLIRNSHPPYDHRRALSIFPL